MKKELFIKADNYCIKYTTNCEDSIEYIKNHIDELKKVTINFSIIDVPDDKNNIFILNYIDGTNNNIKLIDENEIYVECPWDLHNEKSILTIIFRDIVEMLRQNNNEIKLHASAIEQDGNVALFMAPSEGGKTTTAMAMCQKYGCSFFANDASVVKIIDGIPYMLRGDQIFKVRLNGLRAYSKDIYENEAKKFTDRSEPWYNKSQITAEDIGIKLTEGIYPIKYIFFVKLDSLVEGCTINKYEKNKNEETWFKPKMQLFQNINGTIRGSDLIPIGNNGKLLEIIIPSLDTNKLYLNRVNFVNEMFNKCDIYQLRGQLEDITNFVKEKMNINE